MSIELTGNVKTYKEWNVSLEKYLEVGDEVDEEMADYFRDVLPPEYCTSTMIQMGEPYSHIDGKATYSTIAKFGGRWVYCGHCFYGKIEHEEDERPF